MLGSRPKPTPFVAMAVAVAAGLVGSAPAANARVHHRAHKTIAAQPEQQPPRQGVAGYFGPGAYGPFGYGPFGPFSPAYGPGYYGAPRGDLGFALLGALNGGGLRGFVECGNYYARTPGACGF